ncbi:MAG: zf-HC2 domain-containing protein [Thermoleophilia bacterium]|nr:zf-HC2 domain-containing protein [Thermoleophilia bacterium]
MVREPLDPDRTCARAREWASLQLDGELSELERLLLQRHLARCEDCRTFAGSAAAIARLLRTAPQERPALPVVPGARPARSRARYGVAAAAAALVLAGAGVGTLVASLGDDSSPGQRPAPTEIAQLPPEPPPLQTETTPTVQNV